MRHVAVIPARAGSVGFPGKNRIFFPNTADFLDTVEWLDQVVVSTDDLLVAQMSEERGYSVVERPGDLAGPDVSIKAVFEHLATVSGFNEETVLWLFYIPVLYKNRLDFDKAKKEIERSDVLSLCTFVPAKTHPYSCWTFDQGSRRLAQYVPNSVFRRQDMPAAWMHYHYVCCFKISELPQLNCELINERTSPLFLDPGQAERLVEIDTPEDLERIKAQSTP